MNPTDPVNWPQMGEVSNATFWNNQICSPFQRRSTSVWQNILSAAKPVFTRSASFSIALDQEPQKELAPGNEQCQ